MNPEEQKELIRRMIKANVESANARKAWADMAYSSTLGMKNEEVEVYRNECRELFQTYKQCHNEALKISDMFDAANENEP